MADGVASLSPDSAAADPSRAAQAAAGIAGQAASGKAGQVQGASAKAAKGASDSLTLSPEAKAQVAKLQARDADVKAHEQAHIGAGAGVVTSGASYTYERGPDGQNYAVGGEVSIDASPVKGNPQATIAKAERIQAAALAPADPSGQDRAVASAAATMASQAAAELAAKGTGRTGTSQSGKAASGTAGGGLKAYAGGEKARGSLVDTSA